MKKVTAGLISFSVIIVIAAVLAIVYYVQTKNAQMEELVAQFDLQKEELEEEYTQLAVQYEGYKININNDSLIYKLDAEQVKVQRLREELRQVKSSNATRINELKKELAGLRTIMRGYIIQIDSLNTINQRLKNENKEVTQRYQQVSQTASLLEKEKETLAQKVVLASKLDAINIKITPLNSRRKEDSRVSKIEVIQINFALSKNVTAAIGERYLYARIVKPDNDVLVKNRNDHFLYENKEINYSIRRMVEYNGEQTEVSLFWKVEEFLYPGEYRVDLFIDEYLIGEKSFTLKK